MASSFPLTLLPEELTALIISFLQNSRTALHSSTLTSRTLNRIATPYLYTHITLCPTSYALFRPLAYLLFTSPKHASLVRSIVVKRAYGGNLVPWPVCGEKLDSVLREHVRAYLAGDACIEEEVVEKWVRNVREGGALDVAGLLVRRLPGCARMGFEGFEVVDPRGRT